MRQHRYLHIEAAVVAVVLVVLLLVMIPKWQRAQVAGRATQALRDLATLSRAMEAYNLDHSGLPLLGFVSVQGELDEKDPMIGLSIFGHESYPGRYPINLPGSDASMNGDVDETSGFNIDFFLTKWIPFSGDPITPYLDYKPEPPPAIQLSDRQSIRGHYILSTFAMRIHERRKQREPSAFPWWVQFESEPRRDLVGVYQGPVQNAHRLGLPVSRYDPTNGLLSHGFLVYYDGGAKPLHDDKLREAYLDRHPIVRDHMDLLEYEFTRYDLEMQIQRRNSENPELINYFKEQLAIYEDKVREKIRSLYPEAAP